MAYITSFTYCDSIQSEVTQQGISYQPVTPLQVLAPMAIPGNYTFAIFCSISGLEPGMENSAQFLFIAESDTVVYDTQLIRFQISPEQIELNKPAVMQFNLDLRNMRLCETGTYKTRVFVNQELIGEYKIPVIVGE